MSAELKAIELKMTSAIAVNGAVVKAGEVREFSEADARSLLHRGKARLAVQAATTVQPDAPADDDFEATAVAVQDVVGSADQEKPSRRRSKRGE